MRAKNIPSCEQGPSRDSEFIFSIRRCGPLLMPY
jgi:hypothetical protein